LRALPADHNYDADWIGASVRQCGATATHGTAPVSDEPSGESPQFGVSETVTLPKIGNLF